MIPFNLASISIIVILIFFNTALIIRKRSAERSLIIMLEKNEKLREEIRVLLSQISNNIH